MKRSGQTVRQLFAIPVLLGIAGCMPTTSQYSGAMNEKRNEVHLARMIHEIRYEASGDVLDPIETAALNAFIERNQIGFGDQVAIDTGSFDPTGARQSAIEEHLRLMGIRTALHAPVTHVAPSAASAVLIVDRYVVTSPDCQNWTQDSRANQANAESETFGCANITNLGLMVANPRDLIEGRSEGRSREDRAVSASEAKSNK